ncbi:hypothetical protein [Thermus scotoductus]|uniref:hypothetical protein n=1 Tax=Thermus scotoductus TaxID=37636 RepID=UPI001F014D73|nr:hypothetical protein [Thermus scotoductus]
MFKPHQSKLFGKECTPERPIGALMGSSEGACAAYYHTRVPARSGGGEVIDDGSTD